MVLTGEATAFSAACAVVSTACAVFVAYRDSWWRKKGLAGQLHARIDAAQKSADCWDETDAAKEMKAEIHRQGAVLANHDVALVQVATRSDITEIKTSMATTTAEIKHAAIAIDRIESMLIKTALQGRAA